MTSNNALYSCISLWWCNCGVVVFQNVVVGDGGGGVRVVHLEGLTITSSAAFHRFTAVLTRISLLGTKEDEGNE